MAGPQRKSVNKKKVVPIKTVHIGAVDYKDTALLRKFISERGKIRARRVTGLSVGVRAHRAVPRTDTPGRGPVSGPRRGRAVPRSAVSVSP